MVTVDQATPEGMIFATVHMRDQDRREALACIGPFDPHQLALSHLETSRPAAWQFTDAGETIAVWGIARTSAAHIGIPWAWGTDRFHRAVPLITRLQVDIRPWLREEGLRRLEIRSIVDHDISHRWLAREDIGFTREGILRSYGVNGEDFALYSLVL